MADYTMGNVNETLGSQNPGLVPLTKAFQAMTGATYHMIRRILK